MALLCWQNLDCDWFQNPVLPSVRGQILSQGDTLTFTASRTAAANSHPDSQPGQFFEGLWQHDVAEVFFLEPESGRYLEVNLAPNGAWWACWHSGARVRQKRQPDFSKIEAHGLTNEHRWEASIHLPTALFASVATLRFNMTFVLNSPKQSFLSLAQLPGKQPDFHQPEHFLELPKSVPS